MSSLPSTRQAFLLGVWSLFGFLLLVALPPWQPAAFAATLDGSWQAVYHHVPFTDLQFGRDVLLSYGPYGFLHAPYFDPGTYSMLLGRYVLFTLLLGGGFLYATWGERAVGGLPKALLFLLVPFYLRFPDGIVLALAAMYLFLRTQDARAGLRGWEVPFLFALSLAFHAKLNHAAAVLVVVVIASVIHFVRFGRFHTAVPIFLGLALAGWWAAGQGFATIPAFLRGSWEIGKGYGDVLGLQGSLIELVVVATGCLVFLALLVRIRFVPERGARWLEALGLLVVLFFAFESAYVRHSSFLYPSEVLLVLGFLALARAWRTHAPRASVVTGAVAAGVGLLTHLGAIALNEEVDFVDHHTVELSRWRSTLVDMKSGRYRPPYSRLVNRHMQARARIREAYPLAIEGPVDVFGGLQSVALANQLDYAPRPIFQSSYAYTPYLAQRNGEHYRGPSAPPTVVAEIAPVFGIPPSMLDAEAFLELLRTYRFVGRSAQLLVLEHVGKRPIQKSRVLEVELALNEELVVEGALDYWLWAELDVRPSLAGKLAGWLLKLPPVWLELRTKSGLEYRHRVPVRAARGGFLLSPIVRSARDFLLAQGVRRGRVPATHAVRSLRVVVDAADAWAFEGASLTLDALGGRLGGQRGGVAQ